MGRTGWNWSSGHFVSPTGAFGRAKAADGRIICKSTGASPIADACGYRAVFSVLLPATNSVVEPDLAALRPPGVTNQSCRFAFPGQPGSVDELIAMMRPALDLALACRPDRVIVAYTPEYMAGSIAASARLRAFVEEAAGLPATTASDGVAAALEALGARRIGLVTPYPPEANRNLEAWLSAHGVAVVASAGLGSARPRGGSTSRVTEAAAREAFARVDRPEAEALLQVGTALVCSGFAADLEARHGKPVLAINTATYWRALRQHGLADRIDGYGLLLREH